MYLPDGSLTFSTTVLGASLGGSGGTSILGVSLDEGLGGTGCLPLPLDLDFEAPLVTALLPLVSMLSSFVPQAIEPAAGGDFLSILAVFLADRPSPDEPRLLGSCQCFLLLSVCRAAIEPLTSVLEVVGEGEVRSTAESAPVTSSCGSPLPVVW